MLVELLIFFATATGLSTALIMLPGMARARVPLSAPAVLCTVALSGGLTGLVTGDSAATTVLPAVALFFVVGTRIRMRQWSFVGAEVFALLALASLAFVVYAAVQTARFAFNPAWALFSAVLLCFELVALLLATSYTFEMVDVLSRRPATRSLGIPAAKSFFPTVAVQVPTYNEPVEVVRPTLESLAGLDYPNYIVQVVDNNTRDPALWRPLEQMCHEFGARFQFIHLENWPGYKAGALNEATRRLTPEVEVIGIVDADYVVEPGFLRAMAPAFADPTVAIVQSPQNYRDWEDDSYLRGLFFSYRYFFDVTMPARSHRNALIFAGTMGLLRRKALEEIGGWNESCVTEDAEASLRILGRGYRGVYEPRPWGSGLMPLSFDGLKKQRYRWALGGVQILRQHWRELLPGARHRMRLSPGQRVHYLLGSLQWFGDPLTAGFTILLAATAVGIAANHRLPVRQLTGAVIGVPLIFLATGLLRALWALRVTARCTSGDAVRALRVWFALSWVVTLACVAGLFRTQAVFLRTPKHKEGNAGILEALGASKVETAFVLLAVLTALAMLRAEPSLAFAVLALMLIFEAGVYGSALWASMAAEGITLTPFRQQYRKSPQNTGDRPGWVTPALAAPAVLAVAAAGAVLASLLVVTPPPLPQGPEVPPLGSILGPSGSPAPSAPAGSPTPGPSPSPSPATLTSPSPSGSPVPAPSASPRPTPSP